jgi:hypothetical protein
MRCLTSLGREGISLGTGDVRSAVRAAVLAQGTRVADTDRQLLQTEGDV